MNEQTMKLSEEELLVKNSLLFIHLRVNGDANTKETLVKQCLDDGANVNCKDKNDHSNSPLHIAVQKEHKAIVQILLVYGASPVQQNANGVSPIDIARNILTDTGKEIYVLLSNAPKEQNQTVPPTEQHKDVKTVAKKSGKKKQFLYTKREGTSGVSGQFYETKLLSLVLLRALTDNDIDLFYLGTNIAKVGAMDDICIRFVVKDESKPVLMCLQAKHRQDRDKGRLTVESLRSDSGDFSYLLYFDSYLKIKKNFAPNNVDDMFDGEFTQINCYFIIYTPVKESFAKKKLHKSKLHPKMDELIHTSGGEVFQFDYDDSDITSLTRMTVEDRLHSLATVFLNFIMAENDKTEVMLSNELVSRYHYLLAREVVEITVPRNTQQEIKYHLAKFRPSLFTSISEYLVTIRNVFFEEMASTRCDKTKFEANEVGSAFQALFQNTCAFTLSKLIGKMVTYKKETKCLEIIEISNLKEALKKSKLNFKEVKDGVSKIIVEPSVIEEAITIKLKNAQFKLHPIFGNLDLAFRGTKDKINDKIPKLADKFVTILTYYKETMIVDLNDETVSNKELVPAGFIETNRGIGSAVGTLLIKDPMATMFRFNLAGLLPEKSQLLLDHILKSITREELSKYRLHINVSGFPKYSFEGDEYDKRSAKEFLDMLWFYTNQSQEDEVEDILKKEIHKHYNSEEDKNQYTFKIQTDAIYLRSHDEIQKWWMKLENACYLEKSSQFFKQAKNEVIDSPVLTLLNLMYINKIKKIGATFNPVAVAALKLHKLDKRIVNIVTEANDLTGIKIMQYFEHSNDYTFIDFDYILSLPFNDSDLMRELKETHLKTLVLVYETSRELYNAFWEKLEQVITAYKGTNILIVTDIELDKNLKFLGDKSKTIIDCNTYFIDLTETSQNKILKNSKVIFQGNETSYEQILFGKGKDYIRTGTLNRILKQERILIGKPLIDKIYKETENFVERELCRSGETYTVNSLGDVQDLTVIVAGASGMGRSALLTHISLNTKRVSPLPWIVRVNLPDYEVDFLSWQYNEVTINDVFIAQFLCQAALKNWTDEMKNVTLNSDQGQITLNDDNSIKNPITLFELELFLYMYNEGMVVFLFDAYDAICPHYENEVIAILKELHKKDKRMWVTTCTYQHTKLRLEAEFGPLYKLQRLDTTGRKKILNNFFSTNLKLERLNYKQLENVSAFLKYNKSQEHRYLSQEPVRRMIPLFSLLFHYVYITAADFFQSEITRLSPSVINDKLRENYSVDFNQFTPVDDIFGRDRDDELELAGTPLHIYLAANYFKICIEDLFSITLDEEEATKKFDLIMNTCNLYQNYIEAHIHKICMKEDDSTTNEGIKDTYKRTRKEFVDKYKKLGLFTICRENDINKLLKEDEIQEVKTIINKIKNGEDQCGLVSCIVNGIPRFGHLVFAEYFAMEYITDLLKRAAANDTANPLKIPALWHSLINLLLYNASPGLRNAFNYKLQDDPELTEITNTEMCKKVVFELFLKHEGDSGDDIVSNAVQDKLFNIVNLFLKSAQANLSNNNLEETKALINKSKLMFSEFKDEYKELLDKLVESIENFDTNHFGDILKQGLLTEVPLRHAYNYCNSETAKDLTNQVVAITSGIPEINENIKTIVEQAEVLAKTTATVVENTVSNFLQGFLDKLQTNMPGPSTSKD